MGQTLVKNHVFENGLDHWIVLGSYSSVQVVNSGGPYKSCRIPTAQSIKQTIESIDINKRWHIAFVARRHNTNQPLKVYAAGEYHNVIPDSTGLVLLMPLQNPNNPSKEFGIMLPGYGYGDDSWVDVTEIAVYQ